MTNKEYDTYQFIISYIKDNGYPPTVREIADGVGVTSTSTVCERLMKLEKEEWIETKIASPRAIKVIGYEFRKNEEFTMRDTNKESLRLKAEFKKNFFEEIKGNFTEEQLKYIDSTFDTITSKFKFSEKK